VPHLWKLFAGAQLVNMKKNKDHIMPKATVALICLELRGARRTVPLVQARSQRSIDVHH